MSEENIIPKMTLKLSHGAGHCPDGACSVNVENQFRATSKYLLLDGSISVKYGGEETIVVNSPYANTGWMEYVDSWDYDRSVEVTTADPSAVFAQVTLNGGDANNTVYFGSNVQVYSLSNESVTKAVQPDSWIFVRGNSFTLDGVEKSDSAIIRMHNERDVIISSTGSCKVLYIEKT